jgi:ribonuclease III
MSPDSPYQAKLFRHCRFFFLKKFRGLTLDFARLQELWEMEDKISYRFKDWELLNRALTHKSYDNEVHKNIGNHYERLEYLGDSVLDLVISLLLMEKFPTANEGDLSKRRSFLVNTRKLAQVSRQFGLGKYLLLGKGEESSHGRSKHSILACVYEGVVGAIFLDRGYNTVVRVIRSHFEPLISSKRRKAVYRDYKSLLQEYAQSTFKTVPEYKVVKESGPPHAREFEVTIHLNGTVYGSGRGKSKKHAQQRAASATLKQLGFHPAASRPEPAPEA